MKKLLQRLDDGTTSIVDVPVPSVRGRSILVESRTTVVSSGTERMLVEFGRANLIDKARSQPEKVRQVLDKIRADGLAPTVEAVQAKLDMPISLGYCNAGVVVERGDAVKSFSVGDRVVTNGSHAEFVVVPNMLAAKIPDSVSFEAAAFTPLAAIGLQGIRLANPTLGETVVVFGLGLIGLLSVQLLRANGCQVIGVDTDVERLSLAESVGAIAINGSLADPVQAVLKETSGIGADAVLLTLASSSDEPMRQAAAMSRKRGRLVLVGVTGLRLERDDFYRKELSFSVSCSYGPGRYDQVYEDQGRDYPLPFVRWTEQRNFEAVLALMAAGRIDPRPLISHRFAFDDAPKAYDLVASEMRSLGVVLEFPGHNATEVDSGMRTVRVCTGRRGPSDGVVGVIGAGNFAVRTILPLLARSAVRMKSIASGDGSSAAIAARKFGFEEATSNYRDIISDRSIDTVFVLTRHDSHAQLACDLLRAGKHVFVEKPLALREEELQELEEVAARSDGLLTVGFNRRFAPLAVRCRKQIEHRAGQVAFVATVNAGEIPRDHWTQNTSIGGGRIVGESCHWIDLARFLVGASIESVQVTTARDRQREPITDIAHITMEFADGSTGVVHYMANGARSYPKERIECFFDGRVQVIENWRRLRSYGTKSPLFTPSYRMDKGHEAEIVRWLKSTRSGDAPPIPMDEIFEVSRWSVRAAHAAENGVA